MAIFTGDADGAGREIRSREWRVEVIQRLLWVIALAGLAGLMGGCAAVAPASAVVSSVTPSGTLQIFSATEVRLQQNNFVTVKSNVRGQSKGFALFGLITLVPARFNTAMSRLNEQADLKSGSSRTLANLVLEKDSNFYILFSIPRTSVRADVVEFVPNTNGQAQPQPQPPSQGIDP